MNISLHDQYKDYSTVDLLKITMHPGSYEHAVIIEATEILKTRVITQADIEKAEDGFREDASPAPKKGLLANIFKISSYNHEKWLNVILAIAVFEYLHLLYTDIIVFDHLLYGYDYPYRMVNALSYIDLLYLPFVYYMFYKRMRWGWIALFGVKLFTIEPSLLFYFNEYWPVEHGIGLLPYSLLTILLDIPILIFLWKQEISNIFNVNSRTKRLTVLSIGFMLALLTCIGRYNRTNYAQLKSNTENQIKTAGEPSDTTTTPPSKLLALIKARNEKPVDTTYMPTGFYFLAEKGNGISMREEKSDEIYTISPLPFASVKNISKVKFEKVQLQEGGYTNLCMTFDDTGTKDLAKGTGNPLYPKIAVIIANKLLYVVENRTSIKTGIMCVALLGYSEKEMDEMRNSIDIKR
ncbi:hypothetical protein ACFFGT_17330 [Mucilaginibacter angelicae]|uniref:Uncharacterized protein n=1 Tax=Mucilaginibacter angelicae TaxID=869718 RepID=A0ABV6L976_9SPHI